MQMAAAMRTSFGLFTTVLLWVTTFLSAHASDSDLVARTCADMMRHGWQDYYFTKEWCESVLRSHKRSTTAKNPRELALVAIDVLESAAADADAKVSATLRSGSGGHSKDSALAPQYCRLDYADMARTVPVCRTIVEEYKDGGEQPLPPADHFKCVGRLEYAAMDCYLHISFGDKELTKAVSKEVFEVTNRGLLVRAMIEEMLGASGS